MNYEERQPNYKIDLCRHATRQCSHSSMFSEGTPIEVMGSRLPATKAITPEVLCRPGETFLAHPHKKATLPIALMMDMSIKHHAE